MPHISDVSRLAALTLAVVLGFVRSAHAQAPPADGVIEQGTTNVELVSHIQLGRGFSVGDIEVEQEVARPYVYVSRRLVGGVDVIDISEPGKSTIIYRWRIEDPELHSGAGGTDGKYFKLNDRYYYAQGLQFQEDGLDGDLGAVIFDVTGLPDPEAVREVGRIRDSLSPGGFKNLFAYKHSDGRVLLFATANGDHANIYDMQRLLDGAPNHGLIGRLPVPTHPCPGAGMSHTFNDFYIAFDPETGQDKAYAASQPVGTYVFDVTRPEDPKLIKSVACVPGVTSDHTFQVTPDHKYGIAEGHLRYSPIRLFDMDSENDAGVIDRPIGAWTADWKKHAHDFEIRWPYVFVANYMEGLQVFNMMDPENPYTVASFDTYDQPDNIALEGGESFFNEVANGAMGLDIRNEDGLIIVSDYTTGFWAFRLDGFQAWNGNDWGMPNISTVQDWDNGPEGARPATVF